MTPHEMTDTLSHLANSAGWRRYPDCWESPDLLTPVSWTGPNQFRTRFGVFRTEEEALAAVIVHALELYGVKS